MRPDPKVTLPARDPAPADAAEPRPYAPPRLRTVAMFVALQACTPACPEGSTCVDPDADICM